MLDKLLEEDGNTLFRRGGKLEDAAYRYQYALKRLQSRLASAIQEADQENDDVFVQLSLSHLLLNLSRTFRSKQKKYAEEAVSSASQFLAAFNPDSYPEALWARGKAKREVGALEDALIDLREIAIQIAPPQNLELHRFTIRRVKEELEVATQTKQTGNPQDAAVDTITEISCRV